MFVSARWQDEPLGNGNLFGVTDATDATRASTSSGGANTHPNPNLPTNTAGAT